MKSKHLFCKSIDDQKNLTLSEKSFVKEMDSTLQYKNKKIIYFIIPRTICMHRLYLISNLHRSLLANHLPWRVFSGIMKQTGEKKKAFQIRIPADRTRPSWVFASAAEELNSGIPSVINGIESCSVF